MGEYNGVKFATRFTTIRLEKLEEFSAAIKLTEVLDNCLHLI